MDRRIVGALASGVVILIGCAPSRADATREEFAALYPPAVERLRAACNAFQGSGTWSNTVTANSARPERRASFHYRFYVQDRKLRFDMELDDPRNPGKRLLVTLVSTDDLTFEVIKRPADAKQYTLKFAGRDPNQDFSLMTMGESFIHAAFFLDYHDTLTVLKDPGFTVQRVSRRTVGQDTIWKVEFRGPSADPKVTRSGWFEVNQSKLWRVESYSMREGGGDTHGTVSYDDSHGPSPLASGYRLQILKPDATVVSIQEYRRETLEVAVHGLSRV